jgi:predicted TIM-barrel fold metal-dependent hydrolase
MVDVHIHVVGAKLPGVPQKEDPEIPPFDGPPDRLAAFLRREMQAAGIEHALGMGCLDAPPDDPLGIDGTLRLATLVPGLHAIGAADPTRNDPGHFRRVEAALATGRVCALKAYLGYLHYGPDSPRYVRYYELAAQYKLPFIFHTGDTASPRAKLKFAHPLLVDEVAVDHPDVRFVLAHCGNPWLTDAAEVVYKNENVWADLSGLVVGTAGDFHAYQEQGVLREVAEGVRRALRYSEKPDRFLYGSDWPLAPMVAYRDFVRSAIPEGLRDAVFRDNARALFPGL